MPLLTSYELKPEAYLSVPLPALFACATRNCASDAGVALVDVFRVHRFVVASTVRETAGTGALEFTERHRAVSAGLTAVSDVCVFA